MEGLMEDKIGMDWIGLEGGRVDGMDGQIEWVDYLTI